MRVFKILKMSRFQFSCINCGCHIPRQSNNLDAGFEISCWSCNTINIIPNLSEISTVTPTDNNVVNTQSRLNCSNCQTILNQDSNYCSNCGISLHTNDRQKGKKDNSKKITNKTKEKKQTNRLMGFIMVVAYFQSCVAIILFLASLTE